MLINFTKKSGNHKTGHIPTTITERKSCPNNCPWKHKGCYGLIGPLRMHWDINCKRSWNDLCKLIFSLPLGQLWRHNQAGDLPGFNNQINKKQLIQLIKANKNKAGYTYTHKPVLGRTKTAQKNKKLIKHSNQNGFCINLSADNPKHADKLANLNIGPVTVVIPSYVKSNFKTPQGKHIVICPALKNKNMTCLDCQLCAKINRKAIIGFPAHGGAKVFVSRECIK